jgi:uncharacterized protein YigE (DUF2233 family)
MVPDGAVAAVNGGFFDARYRPTGWLIDRGIERAPRHPRSAGGVLAVRADHLYLGPTATLPFTPELAVQNGPRLIEPDGSLGIRTDDGRRAPRTIACDAGGRLHLVVLLAPAREGPTLFEAAGLLQRTEAAGGLGCRAALNLDGGPSTGLWLKPGASIASSDPPAPIAYGLAVVPRARSP